MIFQKSTWLALTFFITIFTFSCTSDPVVEPNPGSTATIWSGQRISFVKEDGTDPTVATNQDRITDNVWITRGNGGGQIFNAATETASDKDLSPTGTLWAVGTTADIENLEFVPFRDAIRPQNSVGVDLVLLLEEDNIAIDLRITSWSQTMEGGFSYERSTQ